MVSCLTWTQNSNSGSLSLESLTFALILFVWPPTSSQLLGSHNNLSIKVWLFYMTEFFMFPHSTLDFKNPHLLFQLSKEASEKVSIYAKIGLVPGQHSL